ncbi:MAG: ribokinase [Chloroflexi bacterium CFX7]|nr:ribokinase [Chloroflexi bacterium CFX7]
MDIVVLGSCMLDIVARIERLPAPGETLFARSLDMFAGGKGANQAIAARRLGAANVTLIGRVGADVFGERVLATLRESGVDTAHVASGSTEGTGVAIPMVFDDGGNSIISVPRANMRMTVDDVTAARDTIAAAGALLLQFEVPMEYNLAAARAARQGGATVILNTAPVAPCPGGLLALADVVVANEVEAAALAPGRPPSPAEQALAFLSPGTRAAIVTLGEQGATLAMREGVTHIPPFPVRSVDTVGAGDAFCGALAVALCEGLGMAPAVRFACAAGAVAVTRPGAAASLPDRAEVEALLAAFPQEP